MNKKRILSTSEAAHELGVSQRYVQSLIQSGQLPAEKVGPIWVIEMMSLERVRERERQQKNPDKVKDRILTTKEVAQELGISLRRVQAMAKAGRIAAKKAGRDWRFKFSDLESVRERPEGRPRKK